MKIETQNYNDVIVVDMQGEMTQETIKVFQDVISNILALKTTGKIVLDMTKVAFIDSIGLETLLALKNSCLRNHCQLKLAGLEENCHKILEITRLAPQFDIYSELTQAVKSFV